MPKKSELGMCKKKNCDRKNNKLCACHSNYLKTGDFLYWFKYLQRARLLLLNYQSFFDS